MQIIGSRTRHLRTSLWSGKPILGPGEWTGGIAPEPREEAVQRSTNATTVYTCRNLSSCNQVSRYLGMDDHYIWTNDFALLVPLGYRWVKSVCGVASRRVTLIPAGWKKVIAVSASQIRVFNNSFKSWVKFDGDPLSSWSHFLGSGVCLGSASCIHAVVCTVVPRSSLLWLEFLLRQDLNLNCISAVSNQTGMWGGYPITQGIQ